MRQTMVAAAAGALLLALPALAQEDILVFDYAGDVLDMADPRQWDHIAAQLGEGLTISGEVSGSFTAAETEQVAYLVSNGIPVAADPFPELDQRIVVFEGEEQVADWTLPETSAYARPITAVDVDGDGISEVLLEGSFYNMGTASIGVDLIKVGEAPEVIQTLPEVYVDSCDAPTGELGISASRISLVDGALVAVVSELPCVVPSAP